MNGWKCVWVIRKSKPLTRLVKPKAIRPRGAVRRFISGYVKRANADQWSSAWRGLGSSRQVMLGAAGVTLISLPLIGMALMRSSSYIEPTNMEALSKALEQRVEGPSVIVEPNDLPERLDPRPSPIAVPKIDQVRFDALDKDRSGVLEKGEILPSDHHLHRVLDVDGKTGISPKEFYTTGQMQYRIAKDWVMKKSQNSYQLKHEGKLEVINVNFDLLQNPPLINPSRPMEETIIEQNDRTVIWAADAKRPHSNWTNDTHPNRDQ